MDPDDGVIDLTGEGRARRAPRRGTGARGRRATESGGAGPGAPAAAGDAAPSTSRQLPSPGTADAAAGRRKRQRKDGKAAGKEKEKRVSALGVTVSWRQRPSLDVLARIQRALPGPGGHRLFLINRQQQRPVGAEGGGEEQFAVLGATGNVYTVTVGRHPHCTCPDAAKGNLCKHVLFVYLRVLGLPQDEPLVWQRALLPSEVDEVLSGNKSQRRRIGGGDVMASAAVQEQYRRMGSGSRQGAAAAAAAAASSRQREVEGDCPICFDALAAAGEAVSFCHACGNNMHASCLKHWAQSRRSRGDAVTCPLCRADMDPPARQRQQEQQQEQQQYANLAAYSDAHRGTDTSLEALYGDRAVWVRASQRGLSRRAAASIWRSLGY